MFDADKKGKPIVSALVSIISCVRLSTRFVNQIYFINKITSIMEILLNFIYTVTRDFFSEGPFYRGLFFRSPLRKENYNVLFHLYSIFVFTYCSHFNNTLLFFIFFLIHFYVKIVFNYPMLNCFLKTCFNRV
jgi:hypothetical protein